MIRVDVVNAHPSYRVPRRPVALSARRALRDRGVTAAAVTVVLHDSHSSRRLHARWLRRDRATDVISFLLEGGARLEGEVYVNLDRARTQARTYGVRFREELARLVIHGALHLTGMRDATPAQRRRMRAREDALLERGD